MQDWTSGVHDWHNVNLSQGFREPGVYYQQAREERFLRAAENNYQTIMGLYGQFPGGGFAGDENCRPGYTDPRQGFETCGMVEFMHSFEMLTKISGNPLWADRCEDMAVNSLPAALTPDLKGLHYLTCANQVQLDQGNKAPEIQNGGTMFSYSPFERYRCCQHNVSHGWPYYAEELWLATPDRGLCASLYAASEVTAKVGAGASVKIVGGDGLSLRRHGRRSRSPRQQPAKFPLYLRIPRWCTGAAVKINGDAVQCAAKPLAYVVLDREWKDGDTVSLRLPMEVRVQRWEKNQNAASVSYGVLTFSLKIGERWQRCGGTDAWPESEVFPTTPWNYGLVLNEKNPAKSFKVVKRARGAFAGAAVHAGNRADRTSGLGKADSGVEAGFARPGGQTATQPGEIRPAHGDGHADSDGGGAAAHHGLPGDWPAGRAHLGGREGARMRIEAQLRPDFSGGILSLNIIE